MEKVVVPQYLADWFEEQGFSYFSLYTLLYHVRNLEVEENRKIYDWYSSQYPKKAQETLAKMWLYGCEVEEEEEEEEEERFYWRKKEYSVFSFENYDHSYLNIVNYNSIQSICFGDKFEGKYSKTKLTTQEVFSLLSTRDIAQLERIKVED